VDFKPKEIMEFGKAHKIVINKMMGLILPPKKLDDELNYLWQISRFLNINLAKKTALW